MRREARFMQEHHLETASAAGPHERTAAAAWGHSPSDEQARQTGRTPTCCWAEQHMFLLPAPYACLVGHKPNTRRLADAEVRSPIPARNPVTPGNRTSHASVRLPEADYQAVVSKFELETIISQENNRDSII